MILICCIAGSIVNDVFDVSTGILWHCGYDKITKISDYLRGVYTRDIHKEKDTNKDPCQAQNNYY